MRKLIGFIFFSLYILINAKAFSYKVISELHKNDKFEFELLLKNNTNKSIYYVEQLEPDFFIENGTLVVKLYVPYVFLPCFQCENVIDFKNLVCIKPGTNKLIKKSISFEKSENFYNSEYLVGYIESKYVNKHKKSFDFSEISFYQRINNLISLYEFSSLSASEQLNYVHNNFNRSGSEKDVFIFCYLISLQFSNSLTLYDFPSIKQHPVTELEDLIDNLLRISEECVNQEKIFDLYNMIEVFYNLQLTDKYEKLLIAKDKVENIQKNYSKLICSAWKTGYLETKSADKLLRKCLNKRYFENEFLNYENNNTRDDYFEYSLNFWTKYFFQK